VVNGCLVGTTITDPGYGYTNNPTPAVRVRDATGAGATAHAVVENGRVVRLEVDNPGQNYSADARILVAAPPFSPTLTVAVTRVAVQMSVVLGRRYQLDVSQDFQSWTPVGNPFTAEDDTVTQELEVTNTGRFFRIQEIR
jgi:hypothetical protein